MELLLFVCIVVLSILSILCTIHNAKILTNYEKENIELKKENGLLKEINSIIVNQDFDFLDFEDDENDL